MTNPNKFNLLSIEEKAELLCHKGELIEMIQTENFDLSLYTLDGHYVELFYSVAYNRISEIWTLNDPKRLELYTNNFDISAVVNECVTAQK
ncbi:MAG: hypothetical protein ACT4ON_07795 [Bacteroidota bacterium]